MIPPSFTAAAAIMSIVSGVVYAQTTTSGGTPTGTGAVAVHTVTVGEAGNAFVPDTLYANAGDIITFQFYPTNHSVIRSQYAYPCKAHRPMRHYS